MHNYVWTLAYVTILNSFYVIIAFILWYHLWVKKLGGKRIESFFSGNPH
jgi:membrane-associated protease RseP (regulator of RpoE activity)